MPELCARVADPATRIISFAVAEIGDDLAGTTQGHTVYRALGVLLRARRQPDAGPVMLRNCDKLRHGGDVARAAVLQSLQRTGQAGLLDWVQRHTTCPNAGSI